MCKLYWYLIINGYKPISFTEIWFQQITMGPAWVDF